MADKSAEDITVGILVASDSFFASKENDGKGDKLKDIINSRQHINGSVVTIETVPDDQEQIKAKLILWSDYLKLDVILTSGGTGFSTRDVTPEATKAVVEKEAPGMALAMLQGSLKITPMAMLSRPVCGIRGKTIIINLPGSPKGAAECFLFVCPVIPHAVDLLKERKREVKKMHSSLFAEGIKYPQQHDSHHQLHKQLTQSLFNPELSQHITASKPGIESTNLIGGSHAWQKQGTRKTSGFDGGSKHRNGTNSYTLPANNESFNSIERCQLKSRRIAEFSTENQQIRVVDECLTKNIEYKPKSLSVAHAGKSEGIESDKTDQQDKHGVGNIKDLFQAENTFERHSKNKGPHKTQNSNPLPGSPVVSVKINCRKQPPKKSSPLPILHKDSHDSSVSISSSHKQVSTIPFEQQGDAKEHSTIQKSPPQSKAIKHAKIYKCKQEGETAYPAVGPALRTFLAQHPLIQGIPLYKGKRQVKRKLVQLCTHEVKPNSDKDDSPFHAIKSLAVKLSPDKWQRGKDLLERNSLEDRFTLTDVGRLALAEVRAGQARDQYVVNWYMWCPGKTNCHRMCGGFGRCIDGCPGMQHKQDRHNCRVMVNLKLFLSDTQNWRVHITGSHVPPDTGVQWIPPCPASGAVDIAQHVKRTKKKSRQVEVDKTPEAHLMVNSDTRVVEKPFVGMEVDGSFLDLTTNENQMNKTTQCLEGANTNQRIQLGEEMIQTSVSKTFASGSECNWSSEPNGANIEHLNALQEVEAVTDRTTFAAPLTPYFNFSGNSSKEITYTLTDLTDNLGSLLGSANCDVKTTKIESDSDKAISDKQTALSMAIIGCSPPSHVSETLQAHLIPSKKRISKMLSKLKHHRMKRLGQLKSRQSRLTSKSQLKSSEYKVSENAVVMLNDHLKNLDSSCITSSSCYDTFNTCTPISTTQSIPHSALYSLPTKDSSALSVQKVHDTFSTNSPQPMMQIEESLPFQLNGGLDSSTNFNNSMEDPGNSIKSSFIESQNIFSLGLTVDSPITFSNSCAAGQLTDSGSLALVSDPVEICDSPMETTGPMHTVQSLYPGPNVSQNLLANSENSTSSKTSSVFSQAKLIERHESLLDFSSYLPPGIDVSQHRYYLQEEVSRLSTRDFRVDPSNTHSLQTTAFDFQQLRPGYSETGTLADHTFNDSFNPSATIPVHQTNLDNTMFWPETIDKTGDFTCAQPDNGEPNHNLETLPTYQEAATFLATQFEFLNSS